MVQPPPAQHPTFALCPFGQQSHPVYLERVLEEEANKKKLDDHLASVNSGGDQGRMKMTMTICIYATSLALGHWCPREKDVYLLTFADDEDEACSGVSKAAAKNDEVWVEETCLRRPCLLNINLWERKVEISTDRKPPAAKGGGQQHRVAQSGSSQNKHQRSVGGKSVLSFRFKELWNQMEVCYEKNNTTKHADDKSRYCLIFALKHPPKLEDAMPNSKPVRRIDFPGIDTSFFGRCRAFKLAITRETLGKLAKHDSFSKLCQFGMLRAPLPSNRHREFLTDVSNVRRIVSLVLSRNKLKSNLEQLNRSLEAVHDVDDHAGFALRATLDQGRFSWYHLLHDVESDGNGATLPVVIAKYDFLRQPKVVRILTRICDGEDGRTNYPFKLFKALMVEDCVGPDKWTIHDYCIRIPRLLLTPCHTKAVGFETEMSNRVLRYFVYAQGFSSTSFLRVSVGDESGQQLRSNDLSNTIVARIRKCLTSGISINGCTYRFLAYSSSQLRECSFWMVRLQGPWTVDVIRRELGDFSECTSASKYAARIGQCFSTTFTSHSGKGALKSNGTLHHMQIPDIPAAKNSRESPKLVHTDGTGMISRRLLDKLLRQVPFAPKDPRDVSIIQVRFGGAKGTLTAWDKPAVTVRRKLLVDGAPQQVLQTEVADVMLRKSMLKFETTYEAIELCAIGTSVPYYLNRNVILILSSLGISDSIFRRLQRQMLDDLDAMLTSSRKAREMLPRLSGPDNTVRSILNDMLVSNLAPQEEPYLFSCLHAIRSHHLFRLQKKSRILIVDGAVLMGGIDETGLLPEGCVFVHSSRYNRHVGGSDDRCIVLGPVLVTKHPVMHVGDVRMLLAISVPKLKSHRNIILFSQKGQRPEPSKMAGSDLDGDEFAVTWDSRLFLKDWNGYSETYVHQSLDSAGELARALQSANEEPLCYTDPDHTSTPFPTAPSDQNQALIDHFIAYAKNDNLGRIAKLWQDHASKKGADCEQCHELAHLHSIAVDFPKSGIIAGLPNRLLMKSNDSRAHWRELKRFPVFHCRRIIGQLYDEVTSHTDASLKELRAFAGRDADRYGQILASSSHTRLQQLKGVYDPTIPGRLGLLVVDDERILEVARRYREWYEDEVTRLMHTYKIRSEGELMTGFIRKLHKLQRRREHPIAEEIRRTMGQLRAKHRRFFFAAVMKLVESPKQLINITDEVHVSDALILSVQEIATTSARSRFRDGDLLLRREAFRLAAAYYYVAYAPNQWVLKNLKISVRFSCPWVVCSDIIAAGLEAARVLQETA